MLSQEGASGGGGAGAGWVDGCLLLCLQTVMGFSCSSCSSLLPAAGALLALSIPQSGSRRQAGWVTLNLPLRFVGASWIQGANTILTGAAECVVEHLLGSSWSVMGLSLSLQQLLGLPGFGAQALETDPASALLRG